MDLQDIRDAVESNGIPMIKRTEKYEDSDVFIGKVFGETVASESPVALELRRACGLGGEPAEEAACQSSSCCSSSCGVACDSDCDCR